MPRPRIRKTSKKDVVSYFKRFESQEASAFSREGLSIDAIGSSGASGLSLRSTMVAVGAKRTESDTVSDGWVWVCDELEP